MREKSWSVPVGKYYCPYCGTQLEKEKNHRVVTKNDKDYYQFHRYSSYPRLDVDVYDYHFKCLECNKRTAFREQRVMKRIQKKQKSRLLSDTQIRGNYAKAKADEAKRVLIKAIIFPTVFFLLCFIALYFVYRKDAKNQLKIVVVLSTIFVLLFSLVLVNAVKRHRGTYKWRIMQTYPYEKEMQWNKLYTYSYNNKSFIDTASKCYCFHCKAEMDASAIKNYIDNATAALCPYCGYRSILPDSIEEDITESLIDELYEYWF